MNVIAFIKEDPVIKKILTHLCLWDISLVRTKRHRATPNHDPPSQSPCFSLDKKTACALFQRETSAGRALLSTQVLKEFYVVVTRKLQEPLVPAVAESIIRDLSSLPVVTINSYDILSAIGRSRNKRLSFWDALIIESAIKGGATKIFTEDLQHGQIIDGLQIENPLVNTPSL